MRGRSRASARFRYHVTIPIINRTGGALRCSFFDRDAYERRMTWYRHARFGMFLHWGLYAIPARGEWIRSVEQMPEEPYRRYFEEFNPVDFDARRWARAAKEAGMQYVVLTAKHHDGFCLFDSQYTDWKSTNTPFGRDIVREFVDAVRAEGLRVGLYYSLLDWHHPDYPHRHDANHPDRNNESVSDEGRDFDRYLDYMHAQVRELCTNYGKIDVLWFDFSYDNLRGEAWRGTELMHMVRSLQPDVIVDNRLEVSGEGYGSLAAGSRSNPWRSSARSAHGWTRTMTASTVAGAATCRSPNTAASPRTPKPRRSSSTSTRTASAHCP